MEKEKNEVEIRRDSKRGKEEWDENIVRLWKDWKAMVDLG